MSRGVTQQRNIFVNWMQTQLFPWKRKNLKTGKDEIVQIQGAMRPIELWEYVFPEESLDEVLTMLDIQKDHGVGWGVSKAKLTLLRKALGISKMPKSYTKVKTNKFIPKDGMAIYPIGIKKDKRFAHKEWGYEQEML